MKSKQVFSLTFLRISLALFSITLLTFGLLSPAVYAQEQPNSPEITALSNPMSPSNNRWAYDLINSDAVNASGITGAGVRVALLDNGIDQRVSKIANKIVGRFDATHSVSGQNDHGTGTSSIIAADPMPEAGIGGVAPGASILDVRVCLNTQCRTEWVIDGLKWAIANNANVISMSLGGSPTIEPATAQLIQDAIASGITVVIAAGNNACTKTYSNGNQTWIKNCTQNSLPKSFPGSQSSEGLIAVGAIGRDLTRNSYSNYGAYVDVVAPGTDVATFYPWGPNAYFAGTSAATPMVAGVVALIKQAAPLATPAQIQAILQSTTTDPVTTILEVWDSCTLVNSAWECTGSSPARWPVRYYTGAGIVNAQNAVEKARQLNAGSLINGVAVSPQDSALNIDWSSASMSGGPYQILLDSKKVGETSNTNFQITSLNNSSQYAVEIIDSSGNKSSPILQTPNIAVQLSTPTISNDQAVYNALYLSVAADPPLDTGILLLDNGDRVTCARSGTSRRFDCGYILPTKNLTGSFKFIDAQGNMSPLSNSLTWNYTGLSAVSGISISVLSETQVSATWDALNGASYYCYYDAGQGAWLTTTSTSVQISGVKPGLPQTFSIYPSDQSCRPTGINSPTYWYLPFLGALSAPTNLQTKNLTAQRLEITLTAPVGADRYAVYRSDGKNWLTGSNSTELSDDFSISDQGKSFSYWVTALDDVQYGSQYGEISNPLFVTVPIQSLQTQTPPQQQNAAKPNISNLISYNPNLPMNPITITKAPTAIVFNSKINIYAKAKSGSKFSFSVTGPCVITSRSNTRATIKATMGVGQCELRSYVQGTKRINSEQKFTTFTATMAKDSIRISGPTNVKNGKVFRVSATTKSKKQLTWQVSGSCELVSQTNSSLKLRATDRNGMCDISAVTSNDDRWMKVGQNKRVRIR